MKPGLLGLMALCAALLWPVAGASAGPRAGERWPRLAAPLASQVAEAEDPNKARVIVKYRDGAALLQDSPRRPQHAGRLGQRLALPLEDGRMLGQRMQGMLGRGLSSRALAERLARQPVVEGAVVDQRRSISAQVPNDPYFGAGQTTVTPVVGQWYLRAPDATAVSATNAVGAWAITEGSASITVAVLDTGVRFDHPDLAGKLWPGYDFVRSSVSNDGDGADADASDPGDWSLASDTCGAHDSSWHGTQVAGLIGAASDNGIGMAGLGRKVMVLPVRVLGKCGGYDSDIIAGMRWAAGLSSSATTNPHPARVLNLSLGSSGTCRTGTQSNPHYLETIAELNAAGVVVVVAAGNDTGHAVNSPANCSGAIAVAGLRHAGSKVGYSNIGPEVALAAPAGNCVNLSGPCLYPLLTTLNAGTTAPGANIYSDSFNPSLGTSFSAPLVAATVALMLSVDPTMSPSQVKAALQTSARNFPTAGGGDSTVAACQPPTTTDQLECYCSTSTCGAGMLDAGGAVGLAQQSALRPTAAFGAVPVSPTAGEAVLLDGRASSASAGRSITGYAWSITSGANLASLTGAVNASTANLATSAAGMVVLSLTVTDSTGASRSVSHSITIAPAPVVTPTPSSGGGGALGWPWLLGLGLAVLGLRRPQQR